MVCFGFEPWGRRMVGADETTELWRPPPPSVGILISQLQFKYFFKYSNYFRIANIVF